MSTKLTRKWPSQEYIKSILNYDPLTGIFTWKSRPNLHKSWDTRFAGKQAGSLDSKGYNMIGIDFTKYQAHILAWIYINGKCETEIDHKDNIRHHNWLENLRPATTHQQGMNKKNRVGRILPKGVYHARMKYKAKLVFNYREIKLGSFTTVTEAKAAYDAAALKYFGEFANVS